MIMASTNGHNEWHQTFTELTYLHGSQFGSAPEAADTMRRLNSRLQVLMPGSRLTNSQMNSRFITLCGQMGYERTGQDLIARQGAQLFATDERFWLPFDEVVSHYVNEEAWAKQQRPNTTETRTQYNEQRPPRNASLEQGMKNVAISHPPQPQAWEQPVSSYNDDAALAYNGSDQTAQIPEAGKRRDAQKRPLQRSGTQRAFDFMARQSQMPNVPSVTAPPIPDDDDLAPPPPLLSPRQIKDKRSSRRSMRYDTEEFMS